MWRLLVIVGGNSVHLRTGEMSVDRYKRITINYFIKAWLLGIGWFPGVRRFYLYIGPITIGVDYHWVKW